MIQKKTSRKALRYLALFVILLGAISVYYFLPLKRPPCKDCNIVFISLDTLSANHLPCYGYERNTAPNLCAFGNENIIFTNMYSNSSYTLPSHVSMLTGLYPHEHKVNTPNKDVLAKEVPFLPQILQSNGYQTYFYIPAHSSQLPLDNVFYRGIHETHDAFHPHDWRPGLEKLKQNNKQGKKTFLFLHTYWTHDPYILEDNNKRMYGSKTASFTNIPSTWDAYYACDEKFITYLDAELSQELSQNKTLTRLKNQIYSDVQILKSNLTQNTINAFCADPRYSTYLSTSYIMAYRQSQIDTNNASQITHLEDSYDSKIKELDAYMKEVFDFIQKSDLKKNTILVITSDHGEEFMEHGAWGHIINLHETSIKIPLFMHIPTHTHSTITSLVQSVDLMPTLLDLVGITYSNTTSGTDMFYIFRKPYTFAEQLWYDVKLFTIRQGDWKLLYKKEAERYIPYGLYNIALDPEEKNNVIFKNPKKARELLQSSPKH